MTDKRPSSTKLRRLCFHYWRYETEHGWRMKCAGCGMEIHPACDTWEEDHQKRRELGGSDEPPNIRPLCKPCHDHKTYKQDIPEIAKGKRVSDSVYGVKRSKGSFRNAKWRKKINGEVVPR